MGSLHCISLVLNRYGYGSMKNCVGNQILARPHSRDLRKYHQDGFLWFAKRWAHNFSVH